MHKITKGSQTYLLLYTYALIALPFFVFHEWHLPAHYIAALAVFALITGLLLTYGTLYAIQEYWNNPYHPLIEIIVGVIFLFSLWLSEVFHFRAGKVFFFFIAVFLLLIRTLKIDFYAKLCLAAILIMANGLLSFRALQGMEILSSYILFKNKFDFEELDLNSWKQNGDSYWNENLKIGFKLTEEFSFYQPKDLSLEQKTGAGQIAGLIASSDIDPNQYPFIRMFYFPSYIPFDKSLAAKEVGEYLKIQVSRQEIEDVQEISPEEKALPNIGSGYWTFYDSLRPRYAKTGFVLLETPTGDKILMHITENLEKGKTHEPGIESVLSSFRFGDFTEGNE